MMDIDTSFEDFLKKTREDRRISREALRCGLVSENELSKIELGKRLPDKPMRDRLLGRLGERGYEFENLLQLEEYAAWQKRDTILELFESGAVKDAELLLREYENGLCEDDKVSQQFCLAMKLQMIDLGFGKPEKKAAYLRKALFLTVAWEDGAELKNMVLAIEELNLLLEYIAFSKPINEEYYYQELLGYMKQERFDEECRAMFASKVAYYYCCFLWEKINNCPTRQERIQLAKQALGVSEEGVESLRDNERSYFAWELLQKEAEILHLILAEDNLPEEECVRYEERKKWNRAIFSVLDELYEETGIPKKTCTYTCFYREYEIYCINDVLRARRKMLGLKKGDFEENGKCTYRTVCRIESGTSGVQRQVARHMMKKMKLAPSFQRARIATDSKLAMRMEKQYRNAMNQGNYMDAEQLFIRVKRLLSMKYLINQQYVGKNEYALDYYLGRITKEEYAEGLQQVLELTLPMEAALQPICDKRLNNGFMQKGEKYLTNTEISTLKTLSYLYGDKTDNPYPAVLLEYYQWLGEQGSMAKTIGMYGFIMEYLESYYGNIGEFEKSDYIGRRILCDEIKLRRFVRVADLLYSRVWNYEQKKKNNLPVQNELNRQEALKKCICIADFCKDKLLKHWLENKVFKF